MLEVVVVGAGPAGLTAAIYLGRFHRRPLVIDAESSRARWIPESHNLPGFPVGIAGPALLSQLHFQAVQYGADIRSGRVNAIERVEGGFRVQMERDSLHTRYVLLATGVQDHLPELPGAEEAVLRSLLRVCPICDAFEATGKRIAVIGRGDSGDREAEFLRTYSSRVTLIDISCKRDSDANHFMAVLGIRVVQAELSDLNLTDGRLSLRRADGSVEHFDAFYSALGCTPRNQLAAALGATMDDGNALRVNHHQETSVAGLYAAGDVVRGLNQVVVAEAEAAIAATDIHNRLRNLATAEARLAQRVPPQLDSLLDPAAAAN